MNFEEIQQLFSELIEKPLLTTQLLSRPPFKFIVDIVGNVIISTGYLKEEFTADELENASNDKNSKTAFLDKLIKILDDGTLRNVKPAKIISGKDAEETNKMLQKLGTNAAIFKSSYEQQKDKKKVSKPKKDKDATLGKEKKKKKQNDNLEDNQEIRGKSKKNKKERKNDDFSQEVKTSSKELPKSNENIEKGKKKKVKKTEEVESLDMVKIHDASKTIPQQRHLKRADSMIAINGDAPVSPNFEFDNSRDEGYSELDGLDKKPLKIEEPGTDMSKNSRLPESEETLVLMRGTPGGFGSRPMTSMGRPGTAASRPAPPKIKKTQIATTELVTPNLNTGIINEITKDLTAKEESNFFMEQDEDIDRSMSSLELLVQGDSGTLVQKIIDKKIEIEDGINSNFVNESENGKSIALEKEKNILLQEKLQDLTKTVYPLARLFDFATDDIESMVKEMERWRSEQRKKEQETQNRKSTELGEKSRLYNIIANLQQDIRVVKEELSRSRGRVLNNSNRIQLFIENI